VSAGCTARRTGQQSLLIIASTATLPERKRITEKIRKQAPPTRGPHYRGYSISFKGSCELTQRMRDACAPLRVDTQLCKQQSNSICAHCKDLSRSARAALRAEHLQIERHSHTSMTKKYMCSGKCVRGITELHGEMSYARKKNAMCCCNYRDITLPCSISILSICATE